MPKLLSREAAAKADQNRYYTGVPCTRGHYSLRITSTGACVKCKEERRQTQENVDYMRDYNKRVRAAMRKARSQAVA